MARHKDIYVYDPKTCDYVLQKKDWKYYLKHFFVYGIIVSVMSTGMLAAYFYYFDAEQTQNIKQENKELATLVKYYDGVVDSLQLRLDSLKKKDKDLYRMILNAEPIDAKEDSLQKQPKANLSNQSIDELSKKIEELEGKITKSSQNAAGLREMAQKSKSELSQIPTIRPVETEVISGFGYRISPITQQKKMHNGIDFNASVGTQVKVTADGSVVEISNRGSGLGLTVRVRHGFGYETTYACLSQARVHHGQRVRKGDVIALTGKSGLSKGPHLHYEVSKNGKPIDPVDYLALDMKAADFLLFKQKANQVNESMD
jgi:murein DD-endopeptidase MepM/ murein hydrolase activator NlpD